MFSTVGEKVSLNISLSVIHIFTFMGNFFQDLHFFGKNWQELAFLKEKSALFGLKFPPTHISPTPF